MRKFIVKTIKATIISLIVALLIVSATVITINIFFGARIKEVIALANMISVSSSNEKQEEIKLNKNHYIENRPAFGEKYATIEIPKIDKNLPVYFGDSLEVLKNGVGHSSGSYFPGEGGSVIYMGHNSQKVFRKLGDLQKGDKIIVTTPYGKYTYKVYDTDLIKETEGDKLKIQQEKEILMIYTCYPFINIGHATQRYVVFAELEK